MDGADVGVVVGTPGHLEEEVDGMLHGLEVAHIENPEVVDAIFVAQAHLFPQVVGGGDVGPLGVARTTHVIDVVVHTPTALAVHKCLLGARSRNVGFGHTTNVTPVVVAKHDEHIVGHIEAQVVEVLHLLVECPHLRRLVGLLACHLGDDAALVADDILEEFLVVVVEVLGEVVEALLAAQSGVAIATHTDGDEVLGATGAFDAFAEELVDDGLIDCIVPASLSRRLIVITGTCLTHLCVLVAHPFLMVASHGFVVRSAHDDAHLVGQRAVERIVEIEGIAPHGGPQVVAFQTEEQFEDVFVKKVVEAAGISVALGIDGKVLALAVGELLLHPTRETGGLVVEEDATIAHCGLAVGVDTGKDKDAVALDNGHIGPPCPWRNTQLAAHFVDSIFRATFVTTRDDEHLTCLALIQNTGIKQCDDILLSFTFQFLGINGLALDQLLDVTALLKRTDKDNRSITFGLV